MVVLEVRRTLPSWSVLVATIESRRTRRVEGIVIEIRRSGGSDTCGALHRAVGGIPDIVEHIVEVVVGCGHRPEGHALIDVPNHIVVDKRIARAREPFKNIAMSLPVVSLVRVLNQVVMYILCNADKYIRYAMKVIADNIRALRVNCRTATISRARTRAMAIPTIKHRVRDAYGRGISADHPHVIDSPAGMRPTMEIEVGKSDVAAGSMSEVGSGWCSSPAISRKFKIIECHVTSVEVHRHHAVICERAACDWRRTRRIVHA